MAEIIAIANQKGGVGKTTTAVNLAAALANLGQDTLLIDLDPQGNATSGIGIVRKSVQQGIYNSLIDGMALERIIQPTSTELLDIACSTADMVSAELELMNAISRENRLRWAIKELKRTYEFMIIDCPPSLGLLTINALVCAQKVFIPVQGEYYSLEGVASFVDAIKKVKQRLNQGLELEGGVLTMFDSRFSLSQQVHGELDKFFKEILYKSTIPRSIRLAEAPSFGRTIFQYEPKSKGSEAYLRLAVEFLSRRGWNGIPLLEMN